MSVHNVSCFNSTIWNCDVILNSSVPIGLIENGDPVNIMTILSTAIASVGIVANMNVVVVFMSQQKLRRKIPNMFIINQVSVSEFRLSDFASLCYRQWTILQPAVAENIFVF